MRELREAKRELLNGAQITRRCTKQKKTTYGEFFTNKNSRLHEATSKNHEKNFHIHSGHNNLCERMHP